jgi:hypothetical protein
MFPDHPFGCANRIDRLHHNHSLQRRPLDERDECGRLLRMVQVRNAKPHAGSAMRATQRKAHQRGERQQRADRGQDRGTMAKAVGEGP